MCPSVSASSIGHNVLMDGSADGVEHAINAVVGLEGEEAAYLAGVIAGMLEDEVQRSDVTEAFLQALLEPFLDDAEAGVDAAAGARELMKQLGLAKNATSSKGSGRSSRRSRRGARRKAQAAEGAAAALRAAQEPPAPASLSKETSAASSSGNSVRGILARALSGSVPAEEEFGPATLPPPPAARDAGDAILDLPDPEVAFEGSAPRASADQVAGGGDSAAGGGSSRSGMDGLLPPPSLARLLSVVRRDDEEYLAQQGALERRLRLASSVPPQRQSARGAWRRDPRLGPAPWDPAIVDMQLATDTFPMSGVCVVKPSPPVDLGVMAGSGGDQPLFLRFTLRGTPQGHCALVWVALPLILRLSARSAMFTSPAEGEEEAGEDAAGGGAGGGAGHRTVTLEALSLHYERLALQMYRVNTLATIKSLGASAAAAGDAGPREDEPAQAAELARLRVSPARIGSALGDVADRVRAYAAVARPDPRLKAVADSGVFGDAFAAMSAALPSAAPTLAEAPVQQHMVLVQALMPGEGASGGGVGAGGAGGLVISDAGLPWLRRRRATQLQHALVKHLRALLPIISARAQRRAQQEARQREQQQRGRGGSRRGGRRDRSASGNSSGYESESAVGETPGGKQLEPSWLMDLMLEAEQQLQTFAEEDGFLGEQVAAEAKARHEPQQAADKQVSADVGAVSEKPLAGLSAGQRRRRRQQRRAEAKRLRAEAMSLGVAVAPPPAAAAPPQPAAPVAEPKPAAPSHPEEELSLKLVEGPGWLLGRAGAAMFVAGGRICVHGGTMERRAAKHDLDTPIRDALRHLGHSDLVPAAAALGLRRLRDLLVGQTAANAKVSGDDMSIVRYLCGHGLAYEYGEAVRRHGLGAMWPPGRVRNMRRVGELLQTARQLINTNKSTTVRFNEVLTFAAGSRTWRRVPSHPQSVSAIPHMADHSATPLRGGSVLLLMWSDSGTTLTERFLDFDRVLPQQSAAPAALQQAQEREEAAAVARLHAAAGGDEPAAGAAGQPAAAGQGLQHALQEAERASFSHASKRRALTGKLHVSARPVQSRVQSASGRKSKAFFGGRGHAAVRDPNNAHSVVVIGGDNVRTRCLRSNSKRANEDQEGAMLNMVMTLDLRLSKMCWEQQVCVGMLPEPRSFHSCCAVRGLIVMAGGQLSDNQRSRDLYTLDTNQWVWHRVATRPTPARLPVSHPSNAFAADGRRAPTHWGFSSQARPSVTDAIGGMPVGRSKLVLVRAGPRRVLVFGGEGSGGVSFSTGFAVDIGESYEEEAARAAPYVSRFTDPEGWAGQTARADSGGSGEARDEEADPDAPRSLLELSANLGVPAPTLREMNALAMDVAAPTRSELAALGLSCMVALRDQKGAHIDAVERELRRVQLHDEYLRRFEEVEGVDADVEAERLAKEQVLLEKRRADIRRDILQRRAQRQREMHLDLDMEAPIIGDVEPEAAAAGTLARREDEAWLGRWLDSQRLQTLEERLLATSPEAPAARELLAQVEALRSEGVEPLPGGELRGRRPAQGCFLDKRLATWQYEGHLRPPLRGLRVGHRRATIRKLRLSYKGSVTANKRKGAAAWQGQGKSVLSIGRTDHQGSFREPRSNACGLVAGSRLLVFGGRSSGVSLGAQELNSVLQFRLGPQAVTIPPSSLLSEWRQRLWQDRMLADVELVTSCGRRFHLHRVVLVAFFPALRAQFAALHRERLRLHPEEASAPGQPQLALPRASDEEPVVLPVQLTAAALMPFIAHAYSRVGVWLDSMLGFGLAAAADLGLSAGAHLTFDDGLGDAAETEGAAASAPSAAAGSRAADSDPRADGQEAGADDEEQGSSSDEEGEGDGEEPSPGDAAGEATAAAAAGAGSGAPARRPVDRRIAGNGAVLPGKLRKRISAQGLTRHFDAWLESRLRSKAAEAAAGSSDTHLLVVGTLEGVAAGLRSKTLLADYADTDAESSLDIEQMLEGVEALPAVVAASRRSKGDAAFRRVLRSLVVGRKPSAGGALPDYLQGWDTSGPLPLPPTEAWLVGADVAVSAEAGSVLIPAHRCILAARSQLFRGAFTIGMAEAEAAAVSAGDAQADRTSVMLLLEFLYTDTLGALGPDEAPPLLELACVHMLPRLVGICERVIAESFDMEDIESVAGMLVFSASLGTATTRLRRLCAHKINIGFGKTIAAETLAETGLASLPEAVVEEVCKECGITVESVLAAVPEVEEEEEARGEEAEEAEQAEEAAGRLPGMVADEAEPEDEFGATGGLPDDLLAMMQMD